MEEPLLLKGPNPKRNGRLARFRNGDHGRNARFPLVALAMFFCPFSASAQIAAKAAGNLPVAANVSGSQLSVVNHLGDPDLGLRDTKLLAHHRSTDPFAVPIRGKFRGLPPAPVQKPITAAGPAPAPGPPSPTLAMAVQQLPVGAVNPNGREMLVASRLVREGDLLIIQLSGHRFFVWVQSIDERGAQFCDLDFKQQTLRPLRTGPRELETDAVQQHPNVKSFLEQK
jgi:hypothetical protein